MDAAVDVLQMDGEKGVWDPGVQSWIGEEHMDQDCPKRTKQQAIPKFSEGNPSIPRSQDAVPVTIKVRTMALEGSQAFWSASNEVRAFFGDAAFPSDDAFFSRRQRRCHWNGGHWGPDDKVCWWPAQS